ncbi:Antimicrobial peptide [Trichinella pseudospiralis]
MAVQVIISISPDDCKAVGFTPNLITGAKLSSMLCKGRTVRQHKPKISICGAGGLWMTFGAVPANPCFCKV